MDQREKPGRTGKGTGANPLRPRQFYVIRSLSVAHRGDYWALASGVAGDDKEKKVGNALAILPQHRRTILRKAE